MDEHKKNDDDYAMDEEITQIDNNTPRKKQKCTNRFAQGSITHDEFIKMINDKKWTGRYLPHDDIDLLKFQKVNGFVRKQVKDKYDWYLSSIGIVNDKPSRQNEQKKVSHKGFDYKISTVEYDKTDHQWKKKYGYCCRAGCKGSIVINNMKLPLKKQETAIYVGTLHSCTDEDKKQALSPTTIQRYDDYRVLFQMSRLPGVNPANVGDIVDYLIDDSNGKHGKPIDWSGLIGGSGDRFWLPNLETSRAKNIAYLNNLIKNWKPYKLVIDFIRRQYPELKLIKTTILASAPNARIQGGDHGRFHFDYDQKTLNQPCEQQPVSVIIGLTGFTFIYNDGIVYQDEEKGRETTRVVDVPAGHFIVFTNRCHHTGGYNKMDTASYRIFLYCVRNEFDLPNDEVYYLERYGKLFERDE
jgi:hypothetical protein